MDPEDFKNLENLVVGKKQTKRLLMQSKISKVYIAADADVHSIDDVVALCQEKKIPLVYVDKKKELGRMCQIDVNAAVVAVLI